MALLGVSMFGLYGCDSDDSPAVSQPETPVGTYTVRILGPREVTLSPNVNETEVTHQLIAEAQPAGDYSYEWHFGDGISITNEPSQGQNSIVSHTYKGLKHGDVFQVEVILRDAWGGIQASDTIMIAINTDQSIRQFSFIQFELMGDKKDITYDNGTQNNAIYVGSAPADIYGYHDSYESVKKSFTNDRFTLLYDKIHPINASKYHTRSSRITAEGEFNSSGFTSINIKEVVTRYRNVHYPDNPVGERWVWHEITEYKEMEYHSIPFTYTENEYGYVYFHREGNHSVIKDNLKILIHTVTEKNDKGTVVDEYNIQPIDWDNLARYFDFRMNTSKSN